MSEKQSLTSISVTGVSVGKYDTVIYTCTVKGTGTDSQAAKDDARPALDSLLALLAQLKAEGVCFDSDGSKLLPTVDPLQRRNSQTHEYEDNGYQAVYNLTLKSETVDRASEVYDRITKLGTVPTRLAYKVKDLTALHGLALLDAKTKLDRQFALQCGVMGIRNPENYDIDNFSVQYNDSLSAGHRSAQMHDAVAAYASLESAGGGDAPVEINAGAAIVTCTLSATYVRLGKLDVRTTHPTTEPKPTHIEEGPHFNLSNPRLTVENPSARGAQSSNGS